MPNAAPRDSEAHYLLTYWFWTAEHNYVVTPPIHKSTVILPGTGCEKAHSNTSWPRSRRDTIPSYALHGKVLGWRWEVGSAQRSFNILLAGNQFAGLQPSPLAALPGDAERRAAHVAFGNISLEEGHERSKEISPKPNHRERRTMFVHIHVCRGTVLGQDWVCERGRTCAGVCSSDSGVCTVEVGGM